MTAAAAAGVRLPGPADRVQALCWRPVLVTIVLKSVLNLAFANRYGWQRDELYYAVAGKHLQGGYVEFPPVTALLAALARVLFGWSLVGFRSLAIAAGGATILVAALVARELGGGRRAQTLAAVVVGFSPLLLATNGLFQPVSFDQLASMLVLWLALRLALGRGSWTLLGVAAGVGLETKYTLAVILAPLAVGLLVWRRDVLRSSGPVLAVVLATVLMAPNLVWQARHGWVSLHWFLHPPGSATDESRLQYVANLFLLTHVLAVPVAAAGTVALLRNPALRPLGATVVATILFYLLAGGKSYYALPVVLFALSAGAVTFDRWATRRRLLLVGAAFVGVLVVLLPVGLPVLPLRTADQLGVIAARSDYQDEVGWPRLARDVGRLAGPADVIVALNYGEAGALELFGRGLPPIASGHVSFGYWRPEVAGRRALLVGITRAEATFCRDYRVVGRIVMPVANEERGRPFARCTLERSLAAVWPRILRASGSPPA